MEVNVGDSVEAVDQLGIWAKAKVVRLVVNFPPWKAEWDREICNPSSAKTRTGHVSYTVQTEKARLTRQ